MFKKIVVPVDGSPCSDEALDVALNLAKSDSAELAICSIVDPVVIVGTTPPSPAIDQMLAAREIESRRLVKAAAEKAGRAGVKAETETHFGIPSEEILRFSKRRGADAIVMGTHGRSGLKRLFLGSVAESVLHGAPCPVIVVREGAAKAAHA
jgi:nucleotide-binding universal stress UspA family protein